MNHKDVQIVEELENNKITEDSFVYFKSYNIFIITLFWYVNKNQIWFRGSKDKMLPLFVLLSYNNVRWLKDISIWEKYKGV